MSVFTSYPGVYIQELPSNAHTIAAAPTSVTVFVGYSHPFKTAAGFGTPAELFSFSDYEREFGGIFQSSVIDNNLPYAVSQFFLNGGTDAIVVGLAPSYYDNTASPPTLKGSITAGSVILDSAAGVGFVFTALEPTDIAATGTSPGTAMKITIGNIQSIGGTNNVADVTITYASQQEVYRKVTIGSTSDPNYIETRINNISALVTVSPNTAYPTQFTSDSQTITTTPPAGTTGVFNPGDYTSIFQVDSALDKWPIFNLLVTPGVPNSSNSNLLNVSQVVLSEALAFCERKLAFYIMDPPSTYVADTGTNAIDTYSPPVSTNGAIYFPYIQSNDPTSGASLSLPPSGTVAGIFGREDTNRGVWKAPAGLETVILNTTGVVASGVMTDSRQGTLNNLGINCLRTFPSVGTVVFGARTLVYPNVALQTQWGYVPVRRMALFIEQTLKAALVWAVFEPNDDPLWTAIRVSIEAFMMSLFNQGAFAGSTPSQAFQVVCDSTTTTPDDVNLGQVNVIVGFAPLKPAEFVIVKITQLAGQAQS